MRKPLYAAVAALVAITLAGCAGAPESAPSEPADTAKVTEESPAPLVAETPAETTEDGGAAQFVTYVRDHLRPNNVIPSATDEELLAAGQDGCTQIEAEVNPDDLSVIEGEERDGGGYFRDSSIIITAARMYLCPEFIDG